MRRTSDSDINRRFECVAANLREQGGARKPQHLRGLAAIAGGVLQHRGNLEQIVLLRSVNGRVVAVKVKRLNWSLPSLTACSRLFSACK